MFLICSEVYCPSSLGRYDTKWSTLRKKSAQKVVFRPALTQEHSFVIKGNVAYIFLTQGRKTVIDRKHLERVLEHRWYAHKMGRSFYADSRSAGTLHRFLTNYKF
jgi:hypothetical protein